MILWNIISHPGPVRSNFSLISPDLDRGGVGVDGVPGCLARVLLAPVDEEHLHEPGQGRDEGRRGEAVLGHDGRARQADDHRVDEGGVRRGHQHRGLRWARLREEEEVVACHGNSCHLFLSNIFWQGGKLGRLVFCYFTPVSSSFLAHWVKRKRSMQDQRR